MCQSLCLFTGDFHQEPEEKDESTIYDYHAHTGQKPYKQAVGTAKHLEQEVEQKYYEGYRKYPFQKNPFFHFIYRVYIFHFINI